MKYFIFGDVHGEYNALMSALKEKEYDMKNPNHQIISLGDNFGRAETGLGSLGIWKYLTSTEHVNAPICIRGNHESIFLNIMRKDRIDYMDLYNGEDLTVASFAEACPQGISFRKECIEKCRKTEVNKWIEDLPWYYETDNYVFVHGWIAENNTKTDWDNATWCNSMEELKHARINGLSFDKTVYAGHWHTRDFWNTFKNKNKNSIYRDREVNIVFMDGCTILSHYVNIEVIEDTKTQEETLFNGEFIKRI